jgi:hypothetical protein
LAYFFSAALAAATSLFVARLPAKPTPSAAHPTELVTIVSWFAALALTSFAVSGASGASLTLAPLGMPPAFASGAAQLICIPALVLFVARDRNCRAPLLPRELFRSPIGVASASLAVAAGIGQACVVVLPACGMVELGVSAAASGPLLSPIVVGGVTANVLVSARLDRWGPKPFLLSGVTAIALGNLATAFLGQNLLAFELGALLLGAGVSSLSSGALRYLATLYGTPADAEANQAAVSLLTNVGVLLGGSLWGALVASASVGAEAIRLGLLMLTAALVPVSFGVLLVPTKSLLRARSAKIPVTGS